MSDNLKEWYVPGTLAVVVLIFLMVVFGISGFRTGLGIMLMFVLPFYLILNNLGFAYEESYFFSFFLGIGYYSTLAYNIALVFSLRTAMILSFILLLAVAFAVKKFYGPQSQQESNIQQE